MSKTEFIKDQLELKGVYIYNDKQLSQLKSLLIDNLLLGLDKHNAFERAFEVVFKQNADVGTKQG